MSQTYTLTRTPTPAPSKEEWTKEMMKWTKPQLIDFLWKIILRNDELAERLSELSKPEEEKR